MDERGLRECYRAHAPVVYRRALQILRDEDDALDVTQDVFGRILDGRQGEVTGRALLAWLYRVTTNLCLNRLRDRKRRSALLATHGAVLSPSPPEHTAGRVEAARVLARLAAAAPERELTAAVCCHVDGMTQEETAEVLGVTSRTVRNLLRRFERRARELDGKRNGT